ncbi:MAG: O-antigen ligase family protein, partial [Candidatus Saccharimonas sp.]|nr:O-antigen ligase family protein [Planctomycetaceae bacterium]
LVQRVKTTADVERMMFGVGLVAIAMSAFALVQYYTSNGKFFWFYAHPYMTTDIRPTGCFTNRNHLAQFLALGIGPLIWCVLRRMEPSEAERADSASLPDNRRLWGTIAVSLGLGCTVLTALSTLSRGGLMAIAVTIVVSVGVLWRLGRVSLMVCLGLVVAAAGIGAVFNLTGSESSLTARIGGDSGREHVWRANIAVAQDFPVLGTGVGTHADAHQLHLEKPLDGGEFTHAESGYLQIMSETGFVGLGLAALFIVVSLWWCCGALRNADTRISSIAAVVLASLLANVSHAACDFFWYTPSCILLLAIQLACVCRLYRSTREEAGRVVRTWRFPALLVWPASGGVLVAAAWMISLKLPAALAEPDHMRYITLNLATPEFYADDDDRRVAQHEKRQAALRAARLDPHDSRLQEKAAVAYMEWFDDRQEQSKNPLPLGQLRDAIQASQFESPAAMHEWLDRSVGKNMKLLKIAAKQLRRALRESPLRARSYVHLAELSFLEAAGAENEPAYLKQALALRPRDPDILFAVGRQTMLAGDLDEAMECWRVAFENSQRLKRAIADLLAGQVTPEFFLEKLKPDWDSVGLLAQAFARVGREEEAREMWSRYVRDGRERLKATLPEAEYLPVVIGLRTAHQSLQQPDEAIRVMSFGLKRFPYSFPLRLALGLDLVAEYRFAEAAEHLQWCAARQPEDKVLQQAAAHAVKERLKSSATSIGTSVDSDSRAEVTR